MMGIKRRLLLFLYSTPNIIGSALGLVGLVLYFTGIIKNYWLLIVAGLYAMGLLATPRSPAYALHLDNQFTREELRKALEDLVASARRRVPQDILTRLESITNSILEILPRIDDLSSGDYNVHVIRQTALEYLPKTLENYLNLPRAFARLHPIKSGKTATQLLAEQLDLLDREMREIVEDIHRNDTQRLLAHGRFLEEKFRPDFWSDLGY